MEEIKKSSIGFVLEKNLTEDAIRSRAPRISTGFPQIDEKLGGGLYPGLIILGAGPSIGKSTFTLQLAENIAANEQENVPVLYFSLEMKDERIAAKMLSRHMLIEAKKAGERIDRFAGAEQAAAYYVTADDLFQKDSVDKVLQLHREAYKTAFRDVKKVKNLYVFQGHYSADQIARIAWEFHEQRVETAKQDGGEPSVLPRKPLVIVDYLQILSTENAQAQKRYSEKQIVEYNLEVMKKLADGEREPQQSEDGAQMAQTRNTWEEEGFPVLLISALNRSNYGREAVLSMKMDAFKETGGIEYSADVLLGLQFRACHEENQRGDEIGCNVNVEKLKYPRELEIICLKQRFGNSDWTVGYRYYSPFDYFEEVDPNQPAEAEEQKSQTLIAKDEQAFMNNTKIANELRKGQKPVREWNKCAVYEKQGKEITTAYIILPQLPWTAVQALTAQIAPALVPLLEQEEVQEIQREILSDLSEQLAAKLKTVSQGKKEQRYYLDMTKALAGDIMTYLYQVIPGSASVEKAQRERELQSFLDQTGLSQALAEQLLEELTPELAQEIMQTPRCAKNCIKLLDMMLTASLAKSDDGAGFVPDLSAKSLKEICKAIYAEAAPEQTPRYVKSLSRQLSRKLEQQLAGKTLLLELTELLTAKLSCFDCDVADAIYTLYRRGNGQLPFTLGQILQELSGGRGKTLTREKKEQIQASVERLRHTWIRIDCTQEMRERAGQKSGEMCVISGPMLMVEADLVIQERKDGAVQYEQYRFAKAEPMPLYEYGALLKQMIVFPRRLLELELSDTIDAIKTKRYLIRRLEVIRKAGRKYKLNKINYGRVAHSKDTGLLADIGLCQGDYQSGSWSNKVRKIRGITVQILNHYKQIGYVTDFEENGTEGVVITGKLNDPSKLPVQEQNGELI